MKNSLCVALLATTVVAYGNGVIDTTKNQAIEPLVVVNSAIPRTIIVAYPRKVEVISKSKIEQSGALNLTELVARAVNGEVVDLQGTTGGVSFRGFAPSAMGTNSYTKLLVNKMPAPSLNSSAMLLNNVMAVEVLKGPYSAIYGSGAMGGVVNIVTPISKGDVKGSSVVSFGSFSTSNLAFNLGGSLSSTIDFDAYGDFQNRGKDYRVGAKHSLHMSDYEKLVAVDLSKGERYDSTRYDGENFGLRLGWDINSEWRLNFYNDFFNSFRSLSNGGFWGVENKIDKSMFRDSHHLDLYFNEGDHSLKVSSFLSNENSNFDNVSRYGNFTNKNVYRTFGGEISYSVRLGRQDIVFGGDNFSQRFNSGYWDEDGTPRAPYNPDYGTIATGFFGQWNMYFFDYRLTGNLGVRYDNTYFRTYVTPEFDSKPDKRSFNDVNESLALKYKITKFMHARVGLGTAYLAPDAYKMTGEYNSFGVCKGNPNLKAESSVSYEVALGWVSPWGPYRNYNIEAEVTYFSTSHKNLIIEDYSNPNYRTYINANKAAMSGLEYNLGVDFGRIFDNSYSLRFDASYTHLFNATVTESDVTLARRYVSRDVANASVGFSNKLFNVLFSARYVGSKIEDNWLRLYDAGGNKVPVIWNGVEVRPELLNEPLLTMPDYVVMDFSVGFNVTKKMTVGAKLLNIFDENYMTRDTYYAPGRNYMLQIGYKF